MTKLRYLSPFSKLSFF